MTRAGTVHRVYGRLRVAALIVAGGCTPTPGSNTPVVRPPATPVLGAVLLPGPRPTFARSVGSANNFEGLPSSSIILRMTSPLPEGPASINLSLAFLSGGATGRLQNVRFDDAPGAQALDAVGSYSVVNDTFGYSIIIRPPVAQRTGTGFVITMKNTAANPPPGTGAESAPLTVSIVPKVARTRPSDVFFDCGTDVVGQWYYNCKPGASIVLSEITLEGWLVTVKPDSCLGDLCVEDAHWEFLPNIDFINSYYGTGGAFQAIVGSRPFAGVMMPGNTPDLQPLPPAVPLAFEDISITDGTIRGVTINSFLLAWNAIAAANGTTVALIQTELNAWHPQNWPAGSAGRKWAGRGPAPAGWMQPVVDVSDPKFAAWSNTRWPWDPHNPDLQPDPIAVGQYVRVNGPLWTDETHDPPANPWEAAVPGQGGWNEIHPVNWIERHPAPALRKTVAVVSTIATSATQNPFVVTIEPDVVKKPGEVLRCREIIDGRFTRPATIVARRSIAIANERVTITVATLPNDRLKATYTMWWEQGATGDTGCAPV